LGLFVSLGCAGRPAPTDVSSVSKGTTNGGKVVRPYELPLRGPGFVVPPRWEARGFQFGTDELVTAVQTVAARVAGSDARVRLGVADLSDRTGGSSRWHRSHHSGRDVDLLFYTTDARGVALPPPENDMIRYDGSGRAYASSTKSYQDPLWASRRFDDTRNWLLIEGLLEDPTIRVQWIFVSEPLKRRLLDEAERAGRPKWAIAYADTVMQQPADSRAHDDHFHVRIYCSRADRLAGCVDGGVVWHHEKKGFKYDGPEIYDPVALRKTLQ
jgi:penicillin-insensitive murein endopeptidase